MHPVKDRGPSRIERLLERWLRQASWVLALCGAASAGLILFAGDQRGSVVSLLAAAAVAVLAVGGGVVRALRSPRRWGLGSATWAASALFALSAGSPLAPAPFGPIAVLIGMAVAFAMAIVVIVAVSARRERRDLPSRM